MNNLFTLNIKKVDGSDTINFANNSANFVEVIFTIDGKETKEGKIPDENTRGYAYPPKLEKSVRKRKDGSLLVLRNRGEEIKAYIFGGEGSYKDQDLDKPTFLRHALVDKVSFKRTGNGPIHVLQVKY